MSHRRSLPIVLLLTGITLAASAAQGAEPADPPALRAELIESLDAGTPSARHQAAEVAGTLSEQAIAGIAELVEPCAPSSQRLATRAMAYPDQS